jgi:hypothetical protein
MDDPVREKMVELVARLDVFGYAYVSDEGSKRVWRGAEQAIRLGQAEGGHGASVWRTQAIRDEGHPWWVLVCDDGCDVRGRNDWGPGEYRELDPRTKLALIERFLRTMIRGRDPETGRSTMIAHYAGGAGLGPDGELHLPRRQG